MLVKRNLEVKTSKDYVYGASYILPDGTFFNLMDIGFKTHCAYEYHFALKNHIKINGCERYLTNLNQWIRINDGTNVEYEVLAELPIKGITEEQYKSLFKFIDYLREKGKTSIDIGCEEHSRGTHFTDKSLWYDTFDLTKFNNKELEFFIRDAYRTFSMYSDK